MTFLSRCILRTQLTFTHSFGRPRVTVQFFKFKNVSRDYYDFRLSRYVVTWGDVGWPHCKFWKLFVYTTPTILPSNSVEHICKVLNKIWRMHGTSWWFFHRQTFIYIHLDTCDNCIGRKRREASVEKNNRIFCLELEKDNRGRVMQRIGQRKRGRKEYFEGGEGKCF